MALARKRKSVRQQVAERAGYRCEYCRITSAVSTSAFEVEHIAPVAHQGSDDLSNLAWACRRCNSIKGIQTTGVEVRGEVPIPLFNPRKHPWSDHFAWDAIDNTQVIGKTPTGRATIRQLELNRPELLLLRRLLAYEKLHPSAETIS